MKKIALGVVTLAVAFSFSLSGAANYNFQADLTLGSTGADVTALQSMLVAKGYLVMPAGVAYGYFGGLTQSAVAKLQMANGITPAAGYFGPVTRAKVNMMSADGGATGGTSTGGSTTLSGGAGDLSTIKLISSGTETTLAEGKEEKVLGMELEADDNSDLAITSIRVNAVVGTDGSTRLNRYVDEVVVYMGDKEVGSMDASDFSRDGADHDGTISLKDAVIKKGDKVRFYVAFVANDVIDSDDLDNEIDVLVDRVRFEDASGAIITADDLADEDAVVVDFEDATANDGAKVQSSSATPDSTILKVDDNSSSDEYHVFTFKIKTDSDSSDVDVLSLPIAFSIVNPSGSAVITEDLITDMYVDVDGEKYDDYEFDNASIAANSTEVATSTITIDEGDLTISGDDTVDAKVYVKFGEQDGKYAASGTKITASVTGASIDAENEDGDNVDITGTVTGKEHSLSTSAAVVDGFKWTTSSVGSYIDFTFTVEADDEAFDVLKSSIASTTAGTATTSAGVLSKISGDATTNSAGVSYTVESGDTATFRVRYSVDGDNGTTAEVTITSVVGQEVPDEDQVSPTVTRNVQS